MKSFKITQSITDRQDASLSIFFKDVSRIPMIDVNKEIELSKRVQEGDMKAANELVKANLRFVISVAKQYQNNGLPLVDLIQEASLGIIEAAKRFDASKGFRFISYAVWWIRQSIIHALSDQCRTIRVPMNQIVTMNKINKATEKLSQELNRNPSAEEISNEINVNTDKINTTLSAINRSVSLDTPFNDDDVSCLLDVIPNENSESVDKELTKENLKTIVRNTLSKLSYREQDVLRMSFGIEMFPMQNDEIANKFGITSERVRQIINEALEKLRKRYGNILKELI